MVVNTSSIKKNIQKRYQMTLLIKLFYQCPISSCSFCQYDRFSKLINQKISIITSEVLN
jgi:L-lysine 2,3-aminomutase